MFNPAKYQALVERLAEEYTSNEEYSPMPLLSAYLSVITTGTINGDSIIPFRSHLSAKLVSPPAKGSSLAYEEKNFDDRRAFLAPLKGMFLLNPCSNCVFSCPGRLLEPLPFLCHSEFCSCDF